MARSSGIHKKGELTLMEIVESVKNHPDFHEAGAIGIFVGVVRGKTKNDETVKEIKLEAYEEKADKVLNDLCDELRSKPGIVDVQIHHLLGRFEVSEELVFAIVAGAHRSDIFPVLREAVERYKKEAPIWKKESLENGRNYWVSELPSH